MSSYLKYYFYKIDRSIAKVFLFFIKIYQKTLSPDQGAMKIFFPHGFCRFHPHCSEYSRQAMVRHGASRGLLLSLWRVLRCNPWSSGGHDPIK